MVTNGTPLAIECVVIPFESAVLEIQRNESILVYPLVEMFFPKFIPFIGPIALISPARLPLFSLTTFQKLSKFLHSKKM